MVPTVRCWKCNTSHVVGKACACFRTTGDIEDAHVVATALARARGEPLPRLRVHPDRVHNGHGAGGFVTTTPAEHELQLLQLRLGVLELELAELRKRPAALDIHELRRQLNVHNVPVHDVVLSMNPASIASGGTYSPGIVSHSLVAPLALELISDNGPGVVLNSARICHMTLYSRADIPCDGRILPVAWPTLDPGVALELEFLNISAGSIRVHANLYGLLTGKEWRGNASRGIIPPSDGAGTASGHSSGIRGS